MSPRRLGLRRGMRVDAFVGKALLVNIQHSGEGIRMADFQTPLKFEFD